MSSRVESVLEACLAVEDQNCSYVGVLVGGPGGGEDGRADGGPGGGEVGTLDGDPVGGTEGPAVHERSCCTQRNIANPTALLSPYLY